MVGRVGETGVDEIVSITASYPGGGLAQLSSAIVANLDYSAMIYGTAGSIEIPVFFAADRAILRAGGEEETEERPIGPTGSNTRSKRWSTACGPGGPRASACRCR